jgi:DNA polymerase III alpha subunit (gram-positive type)
VDLPQPPRQPSGEVLAMGNRIKIDFEFDDSTKTSGKYLVFDIETTGFPININAPPDDFKNWPYVIQIAWLLFDDERKVIEHNCRCDKHTRNNYGNDA